ncbi:MAG: hypothetical protein KAG97_08120 [Victivallales bacterium]|nr:hypothetical protein [Victivallales bacterium]
MKTSEKKCDFDVSELRDLYQPDTERLKLAASRQKAVWEGRNPDAWPLLMNGALTKEQERIPTANFKEAFNSVELMLCSQMRGACSAANSRGDSLPSIRSNLGTGICMGPVGLRQTVFSDKMPWLLQHLTLKQAADLTIDDIRIQGDFEMGLGHMKFFQEVMGDAVPVYCMDTQGPFDLAHLMVGDDIFYALYDDPALVHHIMEIVLEIGIRAHTWMKEVSGEGIDNIFHGNGLCAENMGVRICEDTTVLLSPEAQAEFALPYSKRLAEHFGGAWVHYCGRHDGLTAGILEMDCIRGINFGHIPGHEHDHVFEDDMRAILESGKVYYGSWPLRPNETGKEYLKRLHYWSSQGALITHGDASLVAPDGFDSVDDVLDFWYSL